LSIIKTILFSIFIGAFLFGLVFNSSFRPEDINIQGDKLNIYFFYGDGCPHCAKEEVFLEELEKDYPEININSFETWYNKENASLLKDIADKLDLQISGVPVLIIGEEAIIGYHTDETTGHKIVSKIEQALAEGCEDPVKSVIKNTEAEGRCEHSCDLSATCEHDCGCEADLAEANTPKQASNELKFHLPFVGELDAKAFSLPVLTFLIAATDGFNPCAMWVLLFLISLLINMENKKRMWILGSAFIIASGVVYFLFLSAWLNLFLFLGFVVWVRLLIGLVAIASGEWHLMDAYKNRDGGCHVIKSEKRKRVFGRIRELVAKKNFLVALIGIIILAVAVNLVELVCSAGLPAVYTNVLSLTEMPAWKYYAYLLFYILVFMLDDLLVFFIAMTTLKMKGISSKYTVWAQWVGGVVMFILGLLLIFKPEWIMFG
jgi:glutaredoxin